MGGNMGGGNMGPNNGGGNFGNNSGGGDDKNTTQVTIPKDVSVVSWSLCVKSIVFNQSLYTK